MIWGVATVLFALVAIMATRLIATIYKNRHEAETELNKEIDNVQEELAEAAKTRPDDIAMHYLIALRGKRVQKRK